MTDATFNVSKRQLGERGVVEIMGEIGYYQTAAMLLNVDHNFLGGSHRSRIQTTGQSNSVRRTNMNRRIHFAALFVMLIAGLVSGATVDGIQIQSSSHGAGPKTVILVHGWTCDETTWDAQGPALSKQDRV